MKSLIVAVLFIFANILPIECNSQKIESFGGRDRSYGSIPGFAEFGMFRYRNNILKTLREEPKCQIVREQLPNSKSGIEFTYNGGRDYILDLPGNDWTYYLYFGEYPNIQTLNRICIQLKNPSQHNTEYHLNNFSIVEKYFTEYFGFNPSITHKKLKGTDTEYDYYLWKSKNCSVTFFLYHYPDGKELPYINIEELE